MSDHNQTISVESSGPHSSLQRISVSSHPQSFYNWFASIGISRVRLQRSPQGILEKHHIKSWRLVLFILLRINLAIKITYLFYLLIKPEEGKPLDFLTILGICIYIVLAGVAVYSDYYFAQIFPTFELFVAFWNVQTRIYLKLREENREKFKDELNRTAKIRTAFHTCASLNAMIGLAVQYVMDPKGLMFTGSVLKNDSFLLNFLFFIHEEAFLLSVWYQAVAIILIPVLLSSELTVCLRFMEKELIQLDQQSSNFSRLGPSYKLEDILEEYIYLEIIADRLKAISSFLLLITQIIYFAQITSDVFVGIQLMRLGDTLSVAFYSVDCTTGMGYWFFSLYWMGRLDEAMQDFKYALRSYFRKDVGFGGKGHLVRMKVLKTFREIQVFLGPNPVRKGTAAEVIFELFNYYILAAMW